MKNFVFLSAFIFLFTNHFFAQVTLGFQGGEPSDTWSYTSTGADAVAQSEALLAPNKITGTKSLVVGGNTPGGSCISGGSGNGADVLRNFTFSSLDISTSSNSARTLTFNYGTRFPTCVGTGWDSNEDLIFTPYYDGVAQTPVTIVSGNNNAAFSIATSQFMWTVPSCVNAFHFELGITTNRRDELLFIDNVKLTAPSLNTPLPALTAITGSTTVCTGNSQNLSVTPISNTILTWSGIPAGASFTTPNSTTTSSTMGINWGTAAAGTYTISVTPYQDVCGVSTAGTPRTIDITVSDLQVSAIGNATICPGQSTQISASGATNYTWDNGLGAGSSFNVNPAVTTTYQVTGTTGACSGVASVTVSVTNGLNISIIASETTICGGGSSTLTASGATDYAWQPSTGLSATTGAIVTASPSTTTTYTVTGTTNGCQGTATIVVSVDATNVNAGNDVVVCAGNPVVLNATGANSYSWNNGVSNGVSFIPTATQTYAVTGTTVNGCSATDQLVVTVEPSPNVLFSSNIQSGCLPLQVQFTQQATGQNSYMWNFGDGTFSTEANPAHTFYNSGCKDISLEVTSANGCIITLMLNNHICIQANPTASFLVNPDELSESNPVANFINTSENASSWLWNFGDQTTSTAESPIHTFAVGTESYAVTLFAYNADGCMDSMQIFIPFAESPIYYVPNAFTPDGNELNQTFQPVFTAGFDPLRFQLEIFNRWGERLYESSDPELGWDGSYQGTLLPDGAYIWKIGYNLKNSDDRRVLTGHVMLLR